MWAIQLLTFSHILFQICLNVMAKGNELASFDELYDMPEQDILREDCHSLVGKANVPVYALHTVTITSFLAVDIVYN